MLATTLPQRLSLAASAANLRWLLVIRVIVVLGLLSAITYIELTNDSQRHYPIHLSAIFSYALFTLVTALRLRKKWPVTDLEYFAQLLIDVALVTVLLYFSGGASNPFVSYYLVPLTISAAILPWRYTWIIAGLSITAYSLMLFYFQPLGSISEHANHSSGGSSFNQHVLGMWFNFSLSAGLITYFVVKMASSLRQQQAHLVSHREDELRNEQILAVATLAAGTAHELGTPLSTITVLIDEMEQDHQQTGPLKDDLKMLRRQVDSCREILRSLVNTAETRSTTQRNTIAIDDYLKKILEHWQVLRPSVCFELAIATHSNTALLEVDATLEQAICNLLNNAADASEQTIQIALDWDEQLITLSIKDHGAGVPLDIGHQIGKPFLTTKGNGLGLGLGLFLSHATIARYGGEIRLLNHPDGGTLAELQLPRTYQGRANEQA